MTEIHINYANSFYQRGVGDCPRCPGFQDIVVAHSDAPYYSETTYYECGDILNEDGFQPRPFARNWKQNAIEHFKKIQKQATLYSPVRCKKCFYISCEGNCE